MIADLAIPHHRLKTARVGQLSAVNADRVQIVQQSAERSNQLLRQRLRQTHFP